MANGFNYAKGNYSIADIVAADPRVLLIKGATPTYDPDDDFVSDFLGQANNTEITVSGYSRQALTSEATVIDDTNDRAEFQAAKAVYSALAAGETISAALLYDHVGADSANPCLGYYNVTDTPTNGGDVELHPNGTDGTDAWLRVS